MKEIKCDRCSKPFNNKDIGGIESFDGPFEEFESKIKFRRFILKQKFKGWENFVNMIDGFPVGIVSRWKDFDLCPDCWIKIAKFILDGKNFDIIEIEKS